MELPATGPLSLFHAMCAWGDPAAVAEMIRLDRYSGPAISVIEGRPLDSEQWVSRYRHLRQRLEEELIEKLRNGTLVASGYDSNAPIDAPAVTIPPDRWRVLTPDFDESTATSGDRKIIGIVVVLREATTSATGNVTLPATIANAPRLVRLVIREESKEITLDGMPVPVTKLSYDLIALLAEAAQNGSRLVSNAKIEQGLWKSKVPSERAVADCVRNLRKQLTQAMGPGCDSSQLLQN